MDTEFEEVDLCSSSDLMFLLWSKAGPFLQFLFAFSYSQGILTSEEPTCEPAQPWDAQWEHVQFEQGLCKKELNQC
jgi:hypothetical protein